MKTRIAYLLVAFIFLGSCSTNKEEENETVKTDSTVIKQVKPTLKDGPYLETYPGGQKRIEGEIKNGTRFGQWRAYYPDGTTQSEDYFEDGKKNGKTATFYKNGKVRYIGYFTWDKPSGMWEFFDTLGVVVNKKEYK